ncbi:MAG: hypothetical protein WDM70_11645 [Nitrosomonadales bacterium]
MTVAVAETDHDGLVCGSATRKIIWLTQLLPRPHMGRTIALRATSKRHTDHDNQRLDYPIDGE